MTLPAFAEIFQCLSGLYQPIPAIEEARRESLSPKFNPLFEQVFQEHPFVKCCYPLCQINLMHYTNTVCTLVFFKYEMPLILQRR